MMKAATNVIKYFLQTIFPENFILGKFEGLQGIVLTFDDGPHPSYTPLILKELKKHDIKAVFFVTGNEVHDNQDLVKRILEDGHLIGNHTYDHLSVKECAFSEYKKSIEETGILLDSLISGYKFKFFRPPYSDFSLRLLLYILFSDYMLVNWTKDSRDSFIHSAEALLKNIENINVRNGDILLFHDDSFHTVQALPRVIDFFQGKGFEFVLPDL